MPSLQLTRVLLIDDDKEEWLITRDLLLDVENAGSAFATEDGVSSGHRFTLDWVGTYDEGLKSMKNGDFDVYLVDYHLGGRSGLELLREAMEHGVRAPIILLTGQGDPGVDAAAARVGAADYLVKDGLDAALLDRAIRYAQAQHATQETLREAAAQNARLYAAINNANLGVIITGPNEEDNPITFVNPAFEALTGYPATEIIGKNSRFLQGADTDKATIDQMADAIDNYRMFEGKVLNYRKDGSTFWNAMQFSPVADGDGKFSSWVGFLDDVTEEIKVERKIREGRENLESAQRLTHLGSWKIQLDAPEHPVSWSDEVYRILGLEPQSVRPTREFYLSHVHPEDRPGVAQSFEESISKAQPYFMENRVVRPSGEERVTQLRAEVEHHPDGTARRMVGTILDITEHWKAQNQIVESRYRLERVMDAVPIIIWALDENGIFTVSQGTALESIGLDPGQVVGQSIFDVYGKNGPVAEMARRALAGEDAQSLIEVEERIFDVRCAPTRDQNGRITGVGGVSYDVTERVKAERELDESKARFERVVANAPGMVYRFQRLASGKMSFLYVSDGCREIYKLEPEEVLRDAQCLFEVVHPDDLIGLFDSVFVSERDLTPWDWEGRISWPDDQVRWIRGQARPERLEDGATMWDGLVVDITESHIVQEELLRSRRALAQAQHLARIGSFEWNLVNGEVVWSDEMYRLFGFEPGSFQPTQNSILSFIVPGEREGIEKRSREALERGLPASHILRVQRRDGTDRVLQTHSRVETNEVGRVVRLVGSAQDVTETVEAEFALRESEQRYALAAQGANDGLWDWNLLDGTIYLSPRWKSMSGYASAEIGNDPEDWFKLVHSDDIERLRTGLSMHISGENAHFECEYRLKSKDGSYRWMLGRGLAVSDAQGATNRIAGSQTDITDRKHAEAQLSHNAFYDTLTGLPNRALFLDRLERTLAKARRDPEYTFAVLFLDIDRFKKINDSLGHLPGDQLLIEAAKRFELCLRPGDTVARLGGDEFALLVDDVQDSADVNLVAQRIQKELETPFTLDGKEVFVTVSIGIAPSKGGAERPDELLRNADTAMYKAKGAGRARHEVFDAAMHQKAVKLLELESDLWRAVERDELRLHYQPIISLADGRIHGYEALVRWQHPERGLVPPGDFIPLAEETGLIVPIGWWVLGEACRQAKDWAEKYPEQASRFMSVNLSSKQFSQADMIERIEEIVVASGFNPHYLKLEITESVIMENAESASAMLLQLKELGIGLSMDDFGTGYSSLSYLHRFQLDTLKIDRSFVSQMRAHSKNGEIVGTILSLAAGLSMDVVAEGVETEEQLYGLRSMKCGYAQGYFFSRPLTFEKVEELIEQNPVW